jgi:hypothetical protein
MALSTTPAEWLALAAETREMALRMTNPDARATMLEAADGYETLAAYAGSQWRVWSATRGRDDAGQRDTLPRLSPGNPRRLISPSSLA